MLSHKSSRRNSYNDLLARHNESNETSIFGPIMQSINQSIKQSIARFMRSWSNSHSHHSSIHRSNQRLVLAFLLAAFMCVMLLFVHFSFVDQKLHDIVESSNQPHVHSDVQTNVQSNIIPKPQTIVADQPSETDVDQSEEPLVEQTINQPVDVAPVEVQITNSNWLKSYIANRDALTSSSNPPYLVTATRWWCTRPSVNQTNSQSNDQSINQSNDQSSEQSNNQSIDQSVSQSIPGDLDRLLSFIDAALSYSDLVLIAVNMELDQCESAAFVHSYYSQLPDLIHRVRIVPVMPWISITAALNALLLVASHNRAQFILYQSVEAKASITEVNELLSHMHDSETLVTGACLPGQECIDQSINQPTNDQSKNQSTSDQSINPSINQPNKQIINGINNPWNTLAVWHVPSLFLTGFLSVSDSIDSDHVKEQGQEEGPTIAILQLLSKLKDQKSQTKHRSIAKMVVFREALSWTSASVGRDAHHKWKMSTKRERYEAHMQKLGLEHGVVTIVKQKERKTEEQAQQQEQQQT